MATSSTAKVVGNDLVLATGQVQGMADGSAATHGCTYGQAILKNGTNAFTASQSHGNFDSTGIRCATLNGVVDAGNSGTTKTIDWTAGVSQKIAMTGNCTFSFTAPPGPCWLFLRMTQDGTGSRTATWTGGGLAIKWQGGSAPTLTTTLTTGTDIASIFYDGSAYWGTFAAGFA